jgi:hypothetical protein
MWRNLYIYVEEFIHICGGIHTFHVEEFIHICGGIHTFHVEESIQKTQFLRALSPDFVDKKLRFSTGHMWRLTR